MDAMADSHRRMVAEMTADADRLKESTRTPLEAFRLEVTKIKTLAAQGLIDPTTMTRGILAAQDRLAEAQADVAPDVGDPSKFAGALELGSREARSSVLAARGLGAGDGTKDIAKTGREQLAVQKDTKRLQEQFLALLGKAGGEAVDLLGLT